MAILKRAFVYINGRKVPIMEGFEIGGFGLLEREMQVGVEVYGPTEKAVPAFLDGEISVSDAPEADLHRMHNDQNITLVWESQIPGGGVGKSYVGTGFVSLKAPSIKDGVCPVRFESKTDWQPL